MNRGPKDEDLPFTGLEVPEPPPAFRGRVLAKAREELARERARDIWTQVWESRPLRVAWVAATLLLAVAHLVISVRPPEERSRASAPVAVHAPDSTAELAAVVGLSRLDEDLLPQLEELATPPAAESGPAPPKPAERDRKESAS